jgi:hypothetical protein
MSDNSHIYNPPQRLRLRTTGDKPPPNTVRLFQDGPDHAWRRNLSSSLRSTREVKSRLSGVTEMQRNTCSA